jgi:hypothetical protein
LPTFIDLYKEWLDKTTDASNEFVEASALMCLSSIAIGRRYIESTDNTHPNLFLLVVGDSSTPRKSTVVSRAESVVKEVDEGRVGPTDYTSEALFKWMQMKDETTKKTRTKVALFAEEFGSDLARHEAYASTMQSDFCHLYDCKTINKVRVKSTPVFIDKPRVSLFGGCAYNMMERFLGPKDWMTGYLARFLYVAPINLKPEIKRTPPARPDLRAPAVTELMRIKHELKLHPGGRQLTPAAEQHYEVLVDQFKAFAQQDPATSGIFSTYAARFGKSLEKLSILYQCAIDPIGDIDLPAITLAGEFALNVCWPSFKQAYNRTAIQDFQSIHDAVVGLIKSSPGVLYKEIGRDPRFSGKRELRAVLEHLVALRQVREVVTGIGDRALIWSAT